MTSFIYDNDIPPAVLTEIKNALEPWNWVVPVWCERVFVGWNDEAHSENFSAHTNVEYPYRWARITFYPCFLRQNDPAKDALHELIHIPLYVASGWMKETIRTLVAENDAPKFRKVLLEELTERVEAATEDLASRIISRERQATSGYKIDDEVKESK